MARSLGLPTRVAVGYQTGRSAAPTAVPRDGAPSARVARGVARPRDRLVRVRADAGPAGPDDRQRPPGRPAAGPTATTTRRRPRPGPRFRSTKPGLDRHHAARTACKVDVARPRATRRPARERAAGAAPCVALALAAVALRRRVPRDDRAPRGVARGGAGTTPTRVGACSARGPKRSNASPRPVCDRGRRRRRSSSRCVRHPRTAPARAGSPLMDLARLQTAAMYRARSRRARTKPDTAWQRVDAIDAALRGNVQLRRPRGSIRLPRRQRPVAADDRPRSVEAFSVARRACVSCSTNASRSAANARTSASTSDATRSTATNSASWPDRSASRIWPSSWQTQTRAPSVTSRMAREIVARARATASTAVRTPARRQPRVEQRPHDAERDEIPELVASARAHSAPTRPLRDQ